MSENHRKNLTNLDLRARLPLYFRAAAVVGVIGGLVAVLVFLFGARKNPEFRMKNFPTRLSKDVVAEINGYERTETEGDVRKYYIRADKATTFSDNHQELENAFIEIFNQEGTSDRITAAKAIYVPGESKDFTAYLAGAVDILTRDGLRVRTEQVTYKRSAETAEAEELVEFERGTIKGKSVGAFVSVREKKLELLSQVAIDAFAAAADDEMARSDLKNAAISANYAMIDQSAERIDLSENVAISVTPAADGRQPTDLRADRASAFFKERAVSRVDLSGSVEIEQKATPANLRWTKTRASSAKAFFGPDLKRAELTDNVDIETGGGDARPTRIRSGFAVYEKDRDRFELGKGLHIVTVEDDRPTNIRAAEGVYEQTGGNIYLTGNGEIDNGRETVRGDSLTARLYPDRKVRSAESRGSAYLRQVSAERTVEINAAALNADFDGSQNLTAANASGRSSVVLVPSVPGDYSRVTMTAPNAIRVAFRGAGLMERMTTDGRTTVSLNAPDSAPDAADKKLTADRVVTTFNKSGKDLERAEAVGNAELVVEPLRAAPENYRTTVNAPRFDCDFFPTGNNARTCVAAARTRTVRTPTVAVEGRGTQTLTAEKLTTVFDQKTRDVETFDAAGGAKFTELDRNGIADRIGFTGRDGVVRLRGGEPTVWDSKARARAPEIDWDTRARKSFLRGGVSTTYYNQKQTDGATPFVESSKPVFVTAASAEIDHGAETAVFTGNSRAWQADNYVRSERLTIRQREGKLLAEGAVQSLLYDTKKNDSAATVPVFAAADRMDYDREGRRLRYEGKVEIRQGTDRVTAGVADILLNERNEMSQTTVEGSVVMTQPGRRATGDWARYAADGETAVLRGNPAGVEDSEAGSTQGAQVTMYLREKRYVNEARTTQTNTGRIRSVYKVKKN